MRVYLCPFSTATCGSILSLGVRSTFAKLDGTLMKEEDAVSNQGRVLIPPC